MQRIDPAESPPDFGGLDSLAQADGVVQVNL